MTKAIAAYFNVAETFITDLSAEDGYVSFRLNGVWMNGKLSRTGKLVKRYGFWRA